MDMQAVLLIVFTFVFGYIAWRKLDWAICLAIMFSPAYQIRFQVGFLPMTVLEVMVLVIIAVWGVRTVSERIYSKTCPAWLPWRWLLAAFFAVGLLAVLISPDTRGALGLWKAYIAEPSLLFLVFVNTIKTRDQVRSVLWALGASVVIIGYIALIQYVGLLKISGLYGLEHPKRATSVFTFPTAVGKFVGPILALFIAFWLVRVQPKVRSLWEMVVRHLFTAGVTAFGLLALLFSFSRGAVIGVLVAIVFSSFFSSRKKWIWLALAVVLIGSLIVPFTRHEIISVIDVEDTSADVHVVMWKGAWRIIQAHPVLGTGLASFPVVYEQYKEASHTEFFPNPDELYLTIWIEMGLAGLLVFGWLMVKYFHAGLKDIHRQSQDYWTRALLVGLMAAMVSLLVHGFFDTPYFKNDLAVIFWALLGLMVVVSRIKPAPETTNL
ncbi:MAG: O-antigen ligase family protein [Patescibacteria group bacterium]